MSHHQFPDEFLWGVATSAQQIEGGVGLGGRGESIWDRFAREPGRIADGSNADVACDHYHRWPRDLELIRDLGVDAYRFSIAWPRILPDGRGGINEEGLDFYDSLVDGLLEADIQPFVTLYHWDLPQKLEDEGGWVNRDTVDAFAEYADIVARRLGDRVRSWVTHNEPWCIATLGYEEGEHAPGHKDPMEAMRTTHHVLLSHGWATQAIRRRAPDSEVGIVLNLTPGYPARPVRSDRGATRLFDGQFNRWYLDPLFRGSYPIDAIDDRVHRGHLKDASLPFVEAGDLQVISAPLDFLGINYYSRVVLAADDSGMPVAVPQVPETELTDMGWEVYPDGLHDLLVRIHREYAPPAIFITENGAAYADGPDDAGAIQDSRRVEYLKTHLMAAHRAVESGVPLRGYFAWSLLDNFEWAHGYEKRFGLYWVDYETQARLPKASAHWYRDAVRANAVPTTKTPLVPRRVL